ncbi:MAG: aryl-sulfate sulfotransferase, partial [Candidatus Thermoplasmatota archaeon]|nr:aryl-sulfate sulfotransferase [Candidatus Thermoplasmatota archaeon]
MIKFNQHCFKGQAKTVHILEGILICVLFFSSCVVTPVVSTPIDDTVKPDSTPLLINNSYILFSPMLSTTTYLINQDTTVIHRWESNYIPRCSVYLLEDGSILRPAYVSANPVFICGGVGGGVEIIDWYSQVLWQFEYTTSNYCLHHDVEILPNGNILMIAWERKSASEAIAAGRNPDLLAFGELWPDHIIEVQPTGQEGGTIVWEWHIWDHLIQDYDPIRPNYGVVSDHPELINLNYGDADADWNHVNSIDYNEKLDQILLSVHDFGEIWVIDHSTTTTEAAGHSGGLYGRGGDILYRWGNPQAYRAGTPAQQQFYSQHDAQWIPEDYPGAG